MIPKAPAFPARFSMMDSFSPSGFLSPEAFYFHFPFCASKCAYCDFHSLADVDDALVDECLDRSLADLESIGKSFSGAGMPFAPDTLYWGGGTPSLLGARRLQYYGERVKAVFSGGFSPREWTVEVNPESLDADILDALRELGVNRLSIGFQSFSDEVLSWAGRITRRRDNMRALELVSSRWNGRRGGSWSGDLIAGFPGEDETRVEEGIDLIARAGADHLSLYALTVAEGTPLEARADEVDRDRVSALWDSGAESIEARGFKRYEVSNFAKPGRESLHNLHYWRMDGYLGIGPGAVSTLVREDGSALRRENPPLARNRENASSRERGIKAGEWEPVSIGESLEEYLIMSLRTREGAKRSRLEGRFGLAEGTDGRTKLDIAMKRLESKNLLRDVGDGWAATDRGLDLLDRVMIELLEETGS